jgi:glutamate-5-semialdehyde dehydrogenase
METLLVRAPSPRRLPPIAAHATPTRAWSCAAAPRTRALLPDRRRCAAATEEDWRTEYLAPILAVRSSPASTRRSSTSTSYGSQHTDAIVTENYSPRHALPARGRFEPR